ncbi:hypothetical protein HMPREF1221_01727 [Treponema socranskii subsp. paredis ATCC 35535]|nr:hypothetical protein HMPREF1221_01727 [Treponema socranskii subsp. paredis ATCC 35535]
MVQTKETLRNCLEAHSMATVLDLAYTQYSVQWQKIGNMQTSAGSILTVLSLIVSLMIGIISQISNTEKLLNELGIFKYSLYISFVFAIIYLIISAFFVYGIMKPKKLDILKYPASMKDLISKDIIDQISNSDNEIQKCFEIDTKMMLNLNEEIEGIHNILSKNQANYSKCILASFFSLFSCIMALLHVIIELFKNNTFYISIIGILGYLSILGIIVIIFGGKSKWQ